MANISRNNASVLMIISTLIVIFVLVTFFVISENNFQKTGNNLMELVQENNNNNNYNNVEEVSVNNNNADFASSFNNNRKQVFNLSDNEYTYDEARAVCRAHDGDLATLEQMIEAHKRGANWCNYGWSDGQMALYPTQVDYYNKLEQNPQRAGECGKPGVNGGYFENTDFKFGANCYAVKPPPKDDEIQKQYKGFTLDPLARKEAVYREKLDEIGVSPFSENKWSYYQPDSANTNNN